MCNNCLVHYVNYVIYHIMLIMSILYNNTELHLYSIIVIFYGYYSMVLCNIITYFNMCIG